MLLEKAYWPRKITSRIHLMDRNQMNPNTDLFIYL